MEMPECPVCLESYDSFKTIPRVLSCGHSVCEACIRQLPRRFPDTISCPACNQLAKYPESQGPSALPKNIDLLSFILQHNPQSSSSSSSSNSKTQNLNLTTPTDFPHHLWTEELYSNWKNWVVPNDAISIEERNEEPSSTSLCHGRTTSSSLNCCAGFRENQYVSLLLIVSSTHLNEFEFSLSYTARVMVALNRLRERERTQLGFLIKAAWRRGRLCKVYGFWMDLKDGSLFLVCERFGGHLMKMNLYESVSSGPKEDAICCFGLVGMELIEAVMDLHSEGIVSGCLGHSCFCFDNFGRYYVDMNDVLVTGRRFQKCVTEKDVSFGDQLKKTQAFVSPEVFASFSGEGGLEIPIRFGSDVWSLACVLVGLLVGDPLIMRSGENCSEFMGSYEVWMEKVVSALEVLLGTQFEPLQQILCRCLTYDQESRPHLTDVWRCIRGLLIKPHIDILARNDVLVAQESSICCLILGDLCALPKEVDNKSKGQDGDDLLTNVVVIDLVGNSGADSSQELREKVDRELIDGVAVGDFNSLTLQGHRDCITGIAVGGGFLFSSSFDKTVHVWSLQDFSRVQTLRGHEHRIMAVVIVHRSEPLCISGDSGGGIFLWGIGDLFGQEPLKKWYEHKDWRYSGVHSLAASGTEYLYSGSGDKSIKAWSLQDYTLICTMTGHKSVVSSLAIRDGILYSGSWDGTIRLWWLNDHSPLAVLGDDTPGNITSVLSLSVSRHMLIASHENGCIKMWRNDVLVRSIETHNRAILTLDTDEKWLFLGGWNQFVDVQEVSVDEFHVDTRPVGTIACDSVITALLYWEGKLYVGFADKLIKVYYSGN